MTTHDIKRNLIKGSITGAVDATALILMGNGGSSDVFGYNVPIAVPLFVSGVAGSLIADYSTQAVAALIPGFSGAGANIENTIVGASLCGIGNVAIMALLAGMPFEMDKLLPVFLGGAGSYVAADYITEKFLENPQHQLVW
jgi:hypothetical protein